MKKFIFLVLLFSIVNNSSTQVTQEWVSRYNNYGSSDDQGYSIAVDGSGNVYVTGPSFGNASDYDYATIKYNSSGLQQWVTRYNGTGNGLDQPHSIAVDQNGNVYVTGRSYGNGNWDIATIKYNSLGIQQWVQTYNGHENCDDEAYAIVVDAAGNVYITGYSDGYWASNYDIITVKYSTLGVTQWLVIYAGPNVSQDEGNSIAVDQNGNVYVTGLGGNADYTTIKYNMFGVQQWLQTYNGAGNYWDEAFSIAVDNYGNSHVTGFSWGSTYYDYATVKYNSNGVQQWAAIYNGPANDYDKAVSIVIDDNGNVYVTGWSIGNGTGYDYATVKYNSGGVQQWVQRYNGPADSTDIAYSMAIDGSANIYVTGYSRAVYGLRWGDYVTIRYNSSGNQQWIHRYNGLGDSLDRAYSIALDNSGHVYVTGCSIGNGTDYDFTTIKYTQTVGIHLIQEEIPSKFSLSQNYPNPFNPTTKIKFALPPIGQRHAFDVQLIIYDILGREIQTLVNEQLKPGTYEVEWSATGGGSNYPSGVYFYKLSISDPSASSGQGHSETKKMVLIK